MSIVVLKKKSKRFVQPISGIEEYGFSLNGTLRNIGRVGETNLAKSTHRTLFKGNIPRGHGGRDGKYPISISNSGEGVLSAGEGLGTFNDSNTVKRSVQNTKGLIEEKLNFGRQTIQASPGFIGLAEDINTCHCSETNYKHKINKQIWTGENDYILYNIIVKNSICPISDLKKKKMGFLDMNTYLRGLIYKNNCALQL